MPLEMKYFVLKPRAKSKDDRFAKASQDAMCAYADSILQTDPILSKELSQWALNETIRQERDFEK
jgi:hypothetical protein